MTFIVVSNKPKNETGLQHYSWQQILFLPISVREPVIRPQTAYIQAHPYHDPKNLNEFVSVAKERVLANLSDPLSYLRQFGLMSVGDAAGFSARIGLRYLGVQNTLPLLLTQIVADEGLTSLITSRWRQEDQGHYAFGYELVQALTARAALMSGMKLMSGYLRGGIVGFGIKAMIIGVSLGVGNMIGGEITEALGSRRETGPVTLARLGLEIVDAQTGMLKGGAIKKAVPLDVAKVGTHLESKFDLVVQKSQNVHHCGPGADLKDLMQNTPWPSRDTEENYFDYLARETPGIRTPYRIADVSIAREVFGDEHDIQRSLNDGKLPLIYMDGGASTKPLPSVEVARKEILYHYANTHGHTHNPVRITDGYYHAAHDAVLKFAGYEPEGSHMAVFVGQGTTDAINHVARTLFENRRMRAAIVQDMDDGFVSRMHFMRRNIVDTMGRGLDKVEEVLDELFVLPSKRFANRYLGRNYEEAKDTVIFSGMEHHANIVNWQVHAPRAVALPVRDQNTSTVSVDQLKQALKQNKGRVKLVAITGTSNVTGSLGNIREMAHLAHEAGAMILVDGAHLFSHAMGANVAGLGKMNMGEMGVDFLVSSGHKIYAPGSPGVVIMPKSISPEIPARLGGGIVETVTLEKSTFEDSLPGREEAGTPNITGAIQLACALTTLEAIGMQKVWDHELHLTRQAIEGLQAIPGVKIYGDTNLARTPRAGVISFAIDGVHDSVASSALSDYFNIATRRGRFCAQPYVMDMMAAKGHPSFEDLLPAIAAGRWKDVPGLVRASFGAYTTAKDVERLIKAVHYIASNKDFINSQYHLSESGKAVHVNADSFLEERAAY